MVDDDQFPVFTDSNNSLVDNTSSTLDSGNVEYHIIGFNDNSWYIYKYKETEENSYYYIYLNGLPRL